MEKETGKAGHSSWNIPAPTAAKHLDFPTMVPTNQESEPMLPKPDLPFPLGHIMELMRYSWNPCSQIGVLYWGM